MKLTGHRVLVTGGSAGIGLELARGFVARGNRVAICGRNPQKLAAACAALGEVEAIQSDLAEPGAAALLAEQAGQRLGGLSILVNNAGVQHNYAFIERGPEQNVADASEEIQTNLTSLVALTAHCLPVLRASDPAAIVNVSSGLAIAPKASAAVYCATKAAVHSFSKALRYQMEDAAPHVHVFEILPPLVATEMTRGREAPMISPQQLGEEVFRGLEGDRPEILVGKTKLLALLNRLSPGLAARTLRNG